MPPTLIIAALVALLGGLVNPLTSLVKKENFPQVVNAALAIAISCLGGVAVVAFTGQFMPALANPQAWAALSGLIYTSSQAIYHGLFRNSSFDTVLTRGARQGEKTQPAPSPGPPVPNPLTPPFDKRGR